MKHLSNNMESSHLYSQGPKTTTTYLMNPLKDSITFGHFNMQAKSMALRIQIPSANFIVMGHGNQRGPPSESHPLEDY